MARLLSQKAARAALEKRGWVCETGGNHGIKMTKPGERPITLPHHRGAQYGKRLSAAIRRQAGI